MGYVCNRQIDAAARRYYTTACKSWQVSFAIERGPAHSTEASNRKYGRFSSWRVIPKAYSHQSCLLPAAARAPLRAGRSMPPFATWEGLSCSASLEPAVCTSEARDSLIAISQSLQKLFSHIIWHKRRLQRIPVAAKEIFAIPPKGLLQLRVLLA